MENFEFEIPSFGDDSQLDSYIDESKSDTEQTEAKTEKLTKSAAKTAIVGGAEMLTGVIGTITKTDASLSALEYEDLADKISPAVLKIWNSDNGLPKWLEQLLKYSPFFMAGFGVLMFGVSVRDKVGKEKAQQKAKAEKETRTVKEVNPRPEQTKSAKGGENGNESE